MKILTILFLLVHLTSSCIAPKSLTKHKAITRELLTGLKPGKKYVFELKIGTTQVVRIKQVKDDFFTGQIYEKNNDGKWVWSDYSETFENMEKNVARISVYKVDPYLTGAGIAAVTVVVATVLTVFFFSW